MYSSHLGLWKPAALGICTFSALGAGVEDDEGADDLHGACRDNTKCMFLQDDTRICHLRKVYAPNIIQDVFLALVQGVPALRNDVMVINVGTWYDPGSADLYAGDMQQLAHVMKQQRGHLPKQLIWADTAPQHFQYEKGYGWHDAPFGTRGGHEQCVHVDHEEHQQGGWANIIARPLMASLPVAVLNTWSASSALWEFHVGLKDCTHFCHPSVYEVWLAMLLDLLSQWPEGATMPHPVDTSWYNN